MVGKRSEVKLKCWWWLLCGDDVEDGGGRSAPVASDEALGEHPVISTAPPKLNADITQF